MRLPVEKLHRIERLFVETTLVVKGCWRRFWATWKAIDGDKSCLVHLEAALC
jgi:hypothetical protein